MNRLSFKNPLAAVALGIACVYMTLAFMAAGCLFAHAVPSDGHHQHSGTESHSPPCSWACQATCDVGPVSQGAAGMVWAALADTNLFVPRFIVDGPPSALHARAPPISTRG